MRSRDSAKNRRETNDFIGAQGVLKHLKDGPSRRRVGFVVDEVPARGMMAYKRCRVSFLTQLFSFPRGSRNIYLRWRSDWFVQAIHVSKNRYPDLLNQAK